MLRIAWIFVLLLIPYTVCADNIFLKNGVRMDCEAFWQEGNEIVILIENGTTMGFPKSDVDLKKTLKKGKKLMKTEAEKSELISVKTKQYEKEKPEREQAARLAEQQD